MAKSAGCASEPCGKGTRASGDRTATAICAEAHITELQKVRTLNGGLLKIKGQEDLMQRFSIGLFFKLIDGKKRRERSGRRFFPNGGILFTKGR